MFIRLNNRKGQSILEYVVVIAVIIAAVIAMGIYMKRGTMGKLRESSDDIGAQFQPFMTAGNATTSFSGNITRNISGNATLGSESTTTTYGNYTQTRNSNEAVTAPNMTGGASLFNEF